MVYKSGDDRDVDTFEFASGDYNDATDQNIKTSFHCDGRLLTLSFHVMGPDTVRMYLYWNGQFMRFFPEDIKPVFESIFKKDYGGGENGDFMESKAIDECIARMKGKLRDTMFTGFRENDW